MLILWNVKIRLKEAQKLSSGIQLHFHYNNSSINVFNYEIYLKNGTLSKDISACACVGVKITISSNINDLDLVNFYKAMDFYDEGYDIYNRSNIFYEKKVVSL